MEITITRWTEALPPDEAVLLDLFHREGLHPYRWSNSPFDYYPAHQHSYNKIIYVLQGSITWILPEEDQEVETLSGDRVDLSAGTVHAARVGPQGVICLEAHRD